MGRRKLRKQNDGKIIFFEGDLEEYFIRFLENDILKLTENEIPQHENCHGGTSDSILSQVINRCDPNTEELRIIGIFDEDVPLTRNNMEESDKNPVLAENIPARLETCWCEKIDSEIEDKCLEKTYNKNHKKNPILIISNPFSFEGIILRILDKMPEPNKYKTTKDLKKIFLSLLPQDTKKNKCSIKDNKILLDTKSKIEKFFEENITYELLQKKRKSIYELDLLLKLYEK
ncbi:MAG TPA: hypothetical protein VLL98_05015 [Rickettsiales bacterium]|nr:hypothetical protein [Rickettsiales bacterium]